MTHASPLMRLRPGRQGVKRTTGLRTRSWRHRSLRRRWAGERSSLLQELLLKEARSPVLVASRHDWNVVGVFEDAAYRAPGDGISVPRLVVGNHLDYAPACIRDVGGGAVVSLSSPKPP